MFCDSLIFRIVHSLRELSALMGFLAITLLNFIFIFIFWHPIEKGNIVIWGACSSMWPFSWQSGVLCARVHARACVCVCVCMPAHVRWCLCSCTFDASTVRQCLPVSLFRPIWPNYPSAETGAEAQKKYFGDYQNLQKKMQIPCCSVPWCSSSKFLPCLLHTTHSCVCHSLSDFDPCLNNPCKNGGTCRRKSNKAFTCVCPPGWKNELCQEGKHLYCCIFYLSTCMGTQLQCCALDSNCCQATWVTVTIVCLLVGCSKPEENCPAEK